MRWKGGTKPNPPTVTAPVGGEGGSASGSWTLQAQMQYAALSQWPLPLKDKYLWSWGYNPYGQLGLANTTNYSSPKQVGALTTWSSLAAGGYHTLATKS